MGYSISWVAIKGCNQPEILREFSVEKTGEKWEGPESPMCYVDMKNGWHVVTKNHTPFLTDDAQLLTKLSKGAELIACYLEEHVMVSGAFGWRNGQKIWSLEHDLDKDSNHLDRGGALPQCFEGIFSSANAEYESDPSGPDYYINIPINVCTMLTDFTIDTDIVGLDECPFELLAPVNK